MSSPESISLLEFPPVDPTPIFECCRASFASELLAAAAIHFRVFERLARRSLTFDALRDELKLEQRPAHVLVTALLALGFIRKNPSGQFELTPLSQHHLNPSSPFDVTGYITLSAKSPGVQSLIERLESNQPAGGKSPDSGAAFIYRHGLESAMEHEASARQLTLALAGRAKNVAPYLAARVPLAGARLLLDVGGGSGIYSIACLQKNPELKAILWDRPAVLKVAEELARSAGVSSRLQCLPGDMFSDPVPGRPDVILLSNVLHDWDVPQCHGLVRRCAEALPAQGRLLIHDVFLNDELDGPLPLALYSAALFSLTEGRAYSAAEYKHWLLAAALTPSEIIPTLVHCGVLTGTKS